MQAGPPLDQRWLAARRVGHSMREHLVQFDIWGGLGGRGPCWSPRARMELGDEVGGWPGCCPNAGFPGELPSNDTNWHN